MFRLRSYIYRAVLLLVPLCCLIILLEIHQSTSPQYPEHLNKPWFLKEETPDSKCLQFIDLFPSNISNDRIIEQLVFVPEDYHASKYSQKLKKIYLADGISSWDVKLGRSEFFDSSCPVDACEIVSDIGNADSADAVIFRDSLLTDIKRSKNQIWILHFLESPYHTPEITNLNAYNWTATYRGDSDIVTPYGRWYYHHPKITKNKNNTKNYALNKTKKVAWFSSNCLAKNNRLEYANELSKYIDVDIYGSCGSLRCPKNNQEECFKLLNKDYKFYLSFENSNCRDYITEKFFLNGLGNDILPIVMGARLEDYSAVAPNKSFIHVDEFENPKDLAEYLHILDKNDDLYNTYFEWKGTGEFIDTKFWCRLCTMLHYDCKSKHYEDADEWWRRNKICTKSSWNDNVFDTFDGNRNQMPVFEMLKSLGFY